jgi:hypothetical protein
VIKEVYTLIRDGEVSWGTYFSITSDSITAIVFFILIEIHYCGGTISRMLTIFIFFKGYHDRIIPEIDP